MPMSEPLDGFRLAHDRWGDPAGAPVLLLHGWPGDRTDHDQVAGRLVRTGHDDVVPDLRGFGGSDKHRVDPAAFYGVAMSTEVGPGVAVLVGSRGGGARGAG